MAKIKLYKNIFDTKDFSEINFTNRTTIRRVLEKAKVDTKSYSGKAEVYNPETGETVYLDIEDNIGDSVLARCMVNGVERNLDTEIYPADKVCVMIFPSDYGARSVTRSVLSIVGTIAIGVAFIASLTVTAGAAMPLWITVLGIAGTALTVGSTIWGAIDNNDGLSSSAKSAANDGSQNNSPSIDGSQNQVLGNNTFPLVVGKTRCTPFIIGSPYNEYIRNSTTTFDETWLGTKQKQTLLLGIGYAPLFVRNIKIGNLPFINNENNVLSGLLSYKNGEVGKTWENNHVQAEISQLGLTTKTLYPYAIKQKKVDAPLLYCYDKKYSEEATSNAITWQGGTFPTGMRTNSIYFSHSVPYKISVGLSFPYGLYMSWAKDGDYYYRKIPMNLLVQWRPLYKFQEDNSDAADAASESSDYYENIGKKIKRINRHNTWNVLKWTVEEETQSVAYDKSRYVQWRNFKDTSIVPQITYTGPKKSTYFRYLEDDGKPCVLNGWYGHYISHRNGYYKDSFVKDKKKLTMDECRTFVLSEMTSSSYYHYTVRNGKLYKSRWNLYGNHRDREEVLKTETVNYYNAQDEIYLKEHNLSNNKEDNGYTTSVASREISLNYGLSEGTEYDSNPNFYNSKVFSFGKYSCGPQVYKSNSKDPSVEDCPEFKNPEDAKREMRFEISAELTQEDILDLINENPMSKRAGDGSQPELMNKTDTVISGVEIRVIRLTPCYINKLKDNVQYTYSDVVKWDYIKSWMIDKKKLTDDIHDIAEGEKYAKINCDINTFSDETAVATNGYRYNNWKIEDYKAKPLSDSDEEKLVTLAVEVEADKLGYITGSLNKLSVEANAITPAYRQEWIRFWYKESETSYWYYDSYQTEDTFSPSQIVFNKYDFRWYLSSKEEFDKAAPKSINGKLFSETVNNKWRSKFFPKIIHKRETIEPLVDAGNNPVFKDPNASPLEVIYTTVKKGNDWISYIKQEMQQLIDNERYIATEGFINAFTDNNSILQALGFMCSQALGKDAYHYNSTNRTKYIRLWRKSGSLIYYKDTDWTTYQSGRVNMEADVDSTWNMASSDYFNTFTHNSTENTNLTWSFVDIKSSFNMLTVKEAAQYTDNMDLGAGPMSYKCNMYLYSQKKVSVLLQEILSTALGYWYFDTDGRYEFRNVKPCVNPVLLINDDNCISSSFSRSFQKEIAGYHVTYNDEDNNNFPGEFYTLRTGQDETNPTRDITELSFTGVTNRTQARNLSSYILGQTLIQREIWNLELNHTGQVLSIGSLIKLQLSSLCIGTDNGGRISNLVEDKDYIYGFIIDGLYDYRSEYESDGKNVQGVTLMQATAPQTSRVVTLRMASKSKNEAGIKVTNNGVTITYKNLSGKTNLVLFDKKIVKNTELLESIQDSEEQEILEVTSITSYKPTLGDVVSFGNVGSIASLCTVSSLTYKENGCVSVVCYPYSKDVFNSAAKLPSYRSNLTKKAREAHIPVSSEVSREELQDTQGTITNVTNNIITNIINTGDIVSAPSIPTGLSAIAGESSISLSWSIAFNRGLANSILNYELQLSKNSGTTWTTVAKPLDSYYDYVFNRKTDGYPEKSDLANYRFRVKAVNIYNKESAYCTAMTVNTTNYLTWVPGEPVTEKAVVDKDGIYLKWSMSIWYTSCYGNFAFDISINGKNVTPKTGGFDGNEFVYKFNRDIDGYPEKTDLGNYKITIKAYSKESLKNSTESTFTIDTSNYLTWIPPVPVVRAKISDRTISLEISNPNEFYGFKCYRLQVSKDGTNWYSGTTADAYTSEDNWKGTKGGTTETTISQYAQTMPLSGQTRGIPVDTTYYWRALCVTSIPISSNTKREKVSAYCGKVTSVAKATGVKDLVAGAIGTAQLQNSAIIADKIAADAITTDKIVDGNISTVKLSDSAVTSEKIESGAVVADKIAANAVTTVKMAANSINGDRIAANTLDAAKIRAGSITSDQIASNAIKASNIAAHTITGENLNVLAFNKINSFVGGTLDGWTFKDSTPKASITTNTETKLKCLSFRHKATSNEFDILPDNIYQFKFGIKSITVATDSVGKYIYLSRNQTNKCYQWKENTNGEKEWVSVSNTIESAFIQAYKTKTLNFFTTYILGSNVNIKDVPAPSRTDSNISIFCIQLPVGVTKGTIVTSENNNVVTENWQLVTPQIYNMNSGRLTANQIICNDLKSISTTFGNVKSDFVGDGKDKATSNNFWDLKTGEFRIGNDKSLETNDDDDAQYLHYSPKTTSGGVTTEASISMKIRNFIVKSIGSIITGGFFVKKKGAKDSESLLAVNPESDRDSIGTPANTVKVSGTLFLTRTTDVSGTADNKPALIVGGDTTITHLEFDDNEIAAKTNGITPSTLYLNVDGGEVAVGKGGFSVGSNATINGYVRAVGAALTSTNKITTTYPPRLTANAIQLHTVYNADGPAVYGNLINIGGNGAFQFFCEWAGAQTTANQNVKEHLWIRSWRNNQSAWTQWQKLVNFTDLATTTTEGLMSATDKERLDKAAIGFNKNNFNNKTEITLVELIQTLKPRTGTVLDGNWNYAANIKIVVNNQITLESSKYVLIFTKVQGCLTANWQKVQLHAINYETTNAALNYDIILQTSDSMAVKTYIKEYPTATTTTNGLMSSADKTKLDKVLISSNSSVTADKLAIPISAPENPIAGNIWIE